MRHTGLRKCTSMMYIHGHTVRIRNICIYTQYIFSLGVRTWTRTWARACVQWTPLLPCQRQMSYPSPHTHPLLFSLGGQLENLNRRKCCKLCRQHFSLPAKKEEVSQLALAFILTGIFSDTHTHALLNRTRTHTHAECIYFWMGYTSIR